MPLGPLRRLGLASLGWGLGMASTLGLASMGLGLAPPGLRAPLLGVALLVRLCPPVARWGKGDLADRLRAAFRGRPARLAG